MRLFAAALVLAFTPAMHAQAPPSSPSSSPSPSPSSSPTPERADWSRVQALKPGTRVLLNASSRHGACTIQAVTADALTCTSGSQPNVLRADVALLFAILIAVVGAILGFFTDFARTTFYTAN